MSNNTTKGFSNNYAEFQAYAAKGKQRERSESFDSDCIIVECLKKEKIADGSKDACVESKTVAGYIEIDSDYDDVSPDFSNIKISKLTFWNSLCRLSFINLLLL